MNAAEVRWMLETAFRADRDFPGPKCTECHCEDCLPDHPKNGCLLVEALRGPKRRPRRKHAGGKR